MSKPSPALLRNHAEWCRREAGCENERIARLLANIATVCEEKLRELGTGPEAQHRSLLPGRQKAPRLSRTPHPYCGAKLQYQRLSG